MLFKNNCIIVEFLSGHAAWQILAIISNACLTIQLLNIIIHTCQYNNYN